MHGLFVSANIEQWNCVKDIRRENKIRELNKLIITMHGIFVSANIEQWNCGKGIRSQTIHRGTVFS
jgi:hypothetical protein